MLTIQLKGDPNAPLVMGVGADDDGEVRVLVFIDVASGITVECSVSEENKRMLVAAIEKRPVIQTAQHMPPGPSPNGAR